MIKLLKYEIKQSWRMGITLLSSTLIGCLGLVLNPLSALSAIGQIYIGIFTIITIGSPLALFLHSMIGFNREFTRPQGYLMMTLPIKAGDFILAKFTSQLMWNILCFIIISLNAPLIVGRYALLGVIHSELNKADSIVFFTNGFVFYSLAALIIYFSVVVLSMKPRNSSPFMKLILAVILINLTNAFSILIPLVIKGEFSSYMQNNVKEVTKYNIIMNALMAVIFYVMTKKIIEKKVQL